MQAINELFKDLFEDAARPLTDLDAGTADHIQRMEAQNGDGWFTAMIAKTVAAHRPLADARSTTADTLARQKGATDVVALLEEEMRKFLREGEAQIAVTFKGQTPEAITTRSRFYPRGMTPFNDADRGDWATLLQAYTLAIDANEAALPPAFVAEYRTKSAALLGALGTQGGLKGQVSTGYKDAARFVKPLTLQLSENARTLGIRYALEPSKGAAFFDPRYFERSRNTPASIAAGRQRIVTDVSLATDGTALTLRNEGPEPLLFARVPDAAAAKTPLEPVTALTLAPGEARTLKAHELPGTGALLVIHNPSPREGRFRAELA